MVFKNNYVKTKKLTSGSGDGGWRGGERVATCRDYGWGVGGEEANINN